MGCVSSDILWDMRSCLSCVDGVLGTGTGVHEVLANNWGCSTNN